jgi:methionyl-tRNA formyltransferase
MRVVFFGTPEFAVASLRALLRERIAVAGVVTQPDKPQGRSRTTLVPPPVKVVAQAEGLPVLQPTRPVGDLFLAALRRLEPDLGVVVAYGHILRREVLELPPRGLINVHASLLPRFRGAAPIPHAILAGDRETGISIMRMEEGLDTGPVLHRVATPIADDETAGTLTRRLAALGAGALVEAISLIGAGLERPQPQDDVAATYAPKIGRELARLDWTRDAQALERQVRAFDPAPGAWTELDSAPVKLFGATPAVGGGPPGTVLAATDRLVVACGSGALAVREAQPAGKTRLAVADWVRGRGIAAGRRFA